MAVVPPSEKEVYELISTVGTNIDRLRQGINALRQLHDRWTGCNETAINLIAQLTALRSNLDNVHDWLNYAINDLHPQLLSDLDVVMASCALLVRHVDQLVADLRQPDPGATDCAVKLKYAVGGRSMERLRDVAERQSESVRILLAACKCHTTAQRKILLHKSRQIRQEDNLSMKVLARSSKWKGGCMTVLTGVSRGIQGCKLSYYRKFKRKDTYEEPTEKDYDNAAAAIRSSAIDRALQEDSMTLRRETKLMLMGQDHSGKDLVMHQIKVLYAEGYYTPEDRMRYRDAVRSTMRLVIHSMIDLLKDTCITLPTALNNDFAVLLDEVEMVDMHYITGEAAAAVRNLWFSTEFSSIYLKNFEIDFPQYAPYFAQEAQRIGSEEYIPAEADIIRLNQSIGGIKELRFNWDELDVHLFNINGYIPDQFRKRWFHQFDSLTSLVYTVDISLYDRPFYGQTTKSQLLEDIASFESWANSQNFADSSVILLLNNFTRFRDKLRYSPLESLFPDYVPNAADPDTSARQFILKQFKDVNRNQLSIYSFWVDLDMSDNQHLYAALKKTLQHIQQRKARSEVWQESESSISSGTGLTGRLASSRLNLRSRSGSRLEALLSKKSIDSQFS
ncbi:G-protein alpha subunit-domain-containing protein [Boeremia exigua]|uniref:G-protein alpha subunit-domain-containing protein n=1 Tax=Boeremia exigua TaxID=749465 RepID=UPI001E8D113C|nr:G-protein alpha subunit-domain-containing protein [Boeremia exigua]KAH6633449.1 G-protein alpha subunit-domain-containing protein [Boeremia exigua]